MAAADGNPIAPEISPAWWRCMLACAIAPLTETLTAQKT
jgi:hypothetical protein